MYVVTIPFTVRSPNMPLPFEFSDHIFTHFPFQAIRHIHLISPDFIGLINKGKVKVKCTLVHALRLCTGCTAHRGSRGVALL